MARQWGQPFQAADSIWHYPFTDTVTGESGEELSYEGPEGASGTQPQPAGQPGGSPTAPAAPGPTGTWTGIPGQGGQFNYGPSLGTYPGGGAPPPPPGRRTPGGRARTAPATTGTTPPRGATRAGAASGPGRPGIPYGWGVPGFGQEPHPDPSRRTWPTCSSRHGRPATSPGAAPSTSGASTSPGSWAPSAGCPTPTCSTAWGGPATPPPALEPQSPEDVGQRARVGLQRGTATSAPAGTTAPRTWTSSPTSSAGRTPSPAFPRPRRTPRSRTGQGLAQAVAKGIVKPSAHGWQILKTKGYTPDKIGGVAPQQADLRCGRRRRRRGGRARGASRGPTPASSPCSRRRPPRRSLTQEWLTRSGDEQLAMEKAQQAWSQKFQEVGQAFAQRATTAGITGQWDGQDTMAMQQQKYAQDLANRTFAEQQLQNQNATGLGLLQAQIRSAGAPRLGQVLADVRLRPAGPHERPVQPGRALQLRPGLPGDAGPGHPPVPHARPPLRGPAGAGCAGGRRRDGGRAGRERLGLEPAELATHVPLHAAGGAGRGGGGGRLRAGHRGPPEAGRPEVHRARRRRA